MAKIDIQKRESKSIYIKGGKYKFKTARVAVTVVLLVLALILVVQQLYKIQVTEAALYKNNSLRQRIGIIESDPARGAIYDRNMNILADVVQVRQVLISPADIVNDEEAVMIATGLSSILGVDYDEIYEKTQWKDRYGTNIKHRVEMAVAEQVLEFKEKYNIKAIFLKPQFKRVYPYNELASQTIGFTVVKNDIMTGEFGLEKYYDDYLCGNPGRIVTVKNAFGRSADLDYTSCIQVQNGSNIVSTIDVEVQSIFEKNLAAAFADSLPRERVTGIIMDVRTGEIYAMVSLPSYDLNAPGEVGAETLDLINLDPWTITSIENDEKYKSEEEKEKKILEEKLQKLWQNKAVSSSYEPGSTMKTLTLSAALEEKAVNENESFYCSGVHSVADRSIACHLRSGHGWLTAAEGLMQSCNPVAMRAAEKLGASAYLKYFNAFGYNQKTGIDLPFETSGVMHKPENFRSVELATASFGQRFEITPIQLIAGVAAIANGGKLITPHVVKAILDDDGNVIKEFEPEIKRTVLSENTATKITRILADGVASGGAARNAFVKGYEIAAKTGTSEKGVGTTANIASCVAYAPADDPKFAILVVVDEPTVGSIYGGMVAAPVVAKTFAEILPYLGVEPAYTEKELDERLIILRNYENQEIGSAAEDITARGLKYTIIGGGEYVREQSPKAGCSLMKSGNIVLFTESGDETARETTVVPNVYGLSAVESNNRLAGAKLNININGAEGMESRAAAIGQNPEAGETVKIGTIVNVEFRHNSTD